MAKRPTDEYRALHSTKSFDYRYLETPLSLILVSEMSILNALALNIMQKSKLPLNNYITILVLTI